MKITSVLKNGVYVLKEKNIDDSFFKARVLLAYTIGKPKEYLITHDKEEVDFDMQVKFYNYLDRLIAGEPLQYITGNQEFMGFNFCVNKDVLIPQPDTEILVELVDKYLKHINGKENIELFESFDKKKNLNPKILDLCTGSGAIAISLNKILNKSTVYASDISEKALNVAIKNAKQNKATIKFVISDLFEKINDKFDIIVSNPPYIKTDIIKTLSKEVQNEPHLALDGGKDGLDFYRRIIKEARNYLNEEGMLFLEIGFDQRLDVYDILVENDYKNIISVEDLAGNDRVMIAEI